MSITQACAEASSEAIRVVPGIEYSDASNTIHILVWGSKTFFGEALPPAELLQQVRVCRGRRRVGASLP